MKGPSISQEKPPVVLREDPKYVLEQLLSIITTEDYKDLGNHSPKVMGEMGLFAIAQVILLVDFPSVLSTSLSIKPPFLCFRP